MDLNSLSQNVTQDVTQNVTSNVTDTLHDAFVTYLLIPTIVTVLLFLVVYISHIMHKRKVEKAIFEIRDTLRKMQDERQNENLTHGSRVPAQQSE